VDWVAEIRGIRIQEVRAISKTRNQFNIKENPRNRKTTKRGRKRLFNEAIHALRLGVERTFAWEDKFKRLLLRFERIQQRHYGMKLMAYTLINLRAFCGA
jgi:transposase